MNVMVAVAVATLLVGNQTDVAVADSDPSASFETVVVTSRKPDIRRVAGSAHALLKEDLERHEYDDVHRVLQQVPGVTLRDEDGFGLRPNIGMRGAASDRSSKVTLMEDGVLFAPAPYSAAAAYYFPMVTRMDAVEIYKGPAAIRFGPNTIGGAIDMRTRAIPDGSAGGIDLSAGMYRSGKVHGHWGYGNNTFGVLLEGVHLRSDGFKQLDGGGNTGFAKNELMTKLRLGQRGPEGPGQLQLKLGYADEVSNETYLGLSDRHFRATPLRRYAASQRDRMQLGRTQVQLSYGVDTGDFSFDATAYRQDLQRAWHKLNRFATGSELLDVLAGADAGQNRVLAAVLAASEDSQGPEQTLLVGTNDRRFVSQGVQLTGHWSSRGGTVEQLVEVGARLHHDSIERRHTEGGFDMQRGVLLPTGAPTALVLHNMASTRALALHVHDEVSIGPLLLVPGARLEIIEGRFVDRATNAQQVNTNIVPLGGFGAVFQLTKALGLLAGVHQGFSPVAPGQVAGVRPERSLNYEAGARLRGRFTTAELIGFFNDYSNLTGECTLSTGCQEDRVNQQFNGGRVHVYGAEALVSQRWVGPLALQVQVDATYTFTMARFLTAFRSEAPQFGDVRIDDQVPYVPNHQAALRLRLARDAWSVSLASSYMSAMRERAGQGPGRPGDFTDPRVIHDIAAQYAVTEHGLLYLTVTNFINSQYIASRRPFGARPGAPILLQIGFKYQF